MSLVHIIHHERRRCYKNHSRLTARLFVGFKPANPSTRIDVRCGRLSHNSVIALKKLFKLCFAHIMCSCEQKWLCELHIASLLSKGFQEKGHHFLSSHREALFSLVVASVRWSFCRLGEILSPKSTWIHSLSLRHSIFFVWSCRQRWCKITWHDLLTLWHAWLGLLCSLWPRTTRARPFCIVLCPN